MKDVVSIDVINAHIPVRNNNILAGFNSFDIHILESQTSQRVISNATQLQDFFTFLVESSLISNAVRVTSEVSEIAVSANVTERYVKLRLGSSSSVLLCDSNPFPLI